MGPALLLFGVCDEDPRFEVYLWVRSWFRTSVMLSESMWGGGTQSEPLCSLVDCASDPGRSTLDVGIALSKEVVTADSTNYTVRTDEPLGCWADTCPFRRVSLWKVRVELRGVSYPPQLLESVVETTDSTAHTAVLDGRVPPSDLHSSGQHER